MTNISAKSGARKMKKLRSKGNVWVYILLIGLPVAQCAIFTLFVYFNTIQMAFQEFDPVTNEVIGLTFKNFATMFEFLKGDEFAVMLKLSLLSFVCHVCIGVPLGVLFAYYISKKRLFAGGFRILLFLPSIIPALVLVTIYKNFFDSAVPAITQIFTGTKPDSLLNNTDSRIFLIFLYNIFVGFGSSVLMYANKMSQIDPCLMEAANLDGATPMQEFWHVAFPSAYSTISVFFYTSIASIFLDQLNLMSFYGWDASSQGLTSIGYYIYMTAAEANTYNHSYMFAEISALGLIMTCIAIPLTFLTKFIMQKVGPSED